MPATASEPIAFEDLTPDQKRRFGPAIERMRARETGAAPLVSTPATNAEAADPDAWDPDADESSYLSECRRYPMPGGKSTWIFALSGAELIAVQRQIDALPRTLPAADSKVLGFAIQVMACCRRGDSREAPLTWNAAKHRDRLLGTLSSEQLQDIVVISARLGRGREYLPPFVKNLLAGISALCEKWSSAAESLAGFPPELLTTTKEFASQCTRALLLDGSGSTPSDPQEG